jgi:hypothetical protein
MSRFFLLFNHCIDAAELCSRFDKPEGPLWYGTDWLVTSNLTFG